MDSREVLEQALSDYPGTILAISHDRYFINRFANKVAVLGQDGLTEYAGNYDDYLQKTERGDAPEADVPQKTRTELDKEKKRTRQEKERIKEAQDLAQAKEKEIAGMEQTIFDLEALMALPETFKDPEKAAQAAREYQKAQDRIAALYDEWEAADKALKELTDTQDLAVKEEHV
jgi:ATP-binding cassette subfamily F protein 3